MKIYFSCSLTGGRNDEAAYGAMVDHLLAHGHEVLTAHLARPEVMELEQVVEPREVYQRDMEWIRECDALVAEVSTPSHGVGYEIACALEHAKPVLCCARRGARVSKMLTGNDSPGLRLIVYDGEEEARRALDTFLKAVGSD
jgi:nucleoside 2-deoxyribosyltransferase